MGGCGAEASATQRVVLNGDEAVGDGKRAGGEGRGSLAYANESLGMNEYLCGLVNMQM